MELSTVIVLSFFIVSNVGLFISEKLKKKDIERQLQILKNKKLSKGAKLEDLDDDDLKDEIEPKQRYAWIFSVIICLDIWIGGAIITHLWASHFFIEVGPEDSRRALFGDSFGAVNALVSALAFAGMIVAFVLQRYELRLQRKELKDSRDEMERQTMQFEFQNENIRIQRFENLFYNMLNLQQEIVDGLKYNYVDKEVIVNSNGMDYPHKLRRDVDKTVSGREVFRYTYEEAVIILPGGGYVVGFKSFLKIKGMAAYNRLRIPTYYDHYFRHLYRIVQFVDSQGFSFEDSYKYISLLRGTLSRYELVWLYYNALDPSHHKFKKLIEKYSLLNNLRVSLLTRCKEADDFYNKRGITLEEIKRNHCSESDFEYFLTDNDKDIKKYYFSAFWKKEKINKVQTILGRWREMVNVETKDGL